MLLPRSLRWTIASLLALAGACGPDGCGCEPAPQTGLGITVTDDTVRSCELLLRATGGEAPAIRFSGPVIGEFVPKAPHVAVTFAAREDASLTGQELARLEFVGSSAPAELVTARCYGADGAPVDGNPVGLAQ